MKDESRSSQRMRIKLIRALGVCVPMGLLLYGCGGGGGTPPTTMTAAFREFVVPVASNEPTSPPPGSWPDDLVVDSSGDIWLAEHHSDEVGEFKPSGGTYVYTGIPVPTATSEMDSIAVDSSRGLVWVTENAGNKILKLNLNAVVPLATELNVATAADPDPVPGDITLDSNGTPWFDEGYEGGAVTGKIGMVDIPSGQITDFAAPTEPGGLDGIRFDSSGALWFVELTDNKVGRYVNGRFTEYPLPRPDVTPTNIAPDSHGRIWVTEQTGDAIAILDPTKSGAAAWQELPVPTPNSLPSGIAVDPAGNVWFTEFMGSKIGVVPAGSNTVLDFAIPTANSGPEDITSVSAGKAFFTEQYGNKVGEITVSGLPA